MMAGAYTAKPVPNADPRVSTLLTAAVAAAFVLILAIYRPLVRYWIDPTDSRRQTVAAITTRGQMIVPVLRIVLGLVIYSATLYGTAFDPAAHVARALRVRVS